MDCTWEGTVQGRLQGNAVAHDFMGLLVLGYTSHIMKLAALLLLLLRCGCVLSLQIIGVNSGLFLVDIAVLVAMYFAACVFVIFVLAWRHRVRNG